MSPARLALMMSAATFGGLTLQATVAGEPDLTAIGAMSVGIVALATAGVLFPSLEMYGRIVLRGPRGGRRVGLTFDDGPHPVTTRRVLAALARTNHRATFFVLGEKVRRHPEVTREIHAGGHTLGIHGDRHDRLLSCRMPAAIGEQISRARDAVEAATGMRPRFFRPPLGHTSMTTVLAARRAGVTLVGWSLRGYDGLRRRNADAVVERLARILTEGAIVMLHDAAEHDDFEPATVRVLPRIVALLERRRLASVGLDVLLAARGG